MANLNRILLVGRLGANPTVKKTDGGHTLAEFSVATSRRRGDGSTTTDWHRVIAWGKLGQTCAENLEQGATAVVEGSLHVNEYTPRARDGEPAPAKRRSYEVVAERVEFLFKKRSASQPEKIPEPETVAVAEAV